MMIFLAWALNGPTSRRGASAVGELDTRDGSLLVCAVITTVSAYVSLGFSAAALIGSDKSVRTNPMYAFARSFALAVTCTIVMIGRLSTGLTAMAPTMIIV
ncbi:MAG: hypothetical protein H0U77_01380 [Nocardioidaceae bacterium]|nr:hypothetical protein [Nocardioidaceae bacterium]